MKPRQFTRDEIPQQVRDRFWSKVDVRDPDECWEWQAAIARDGYGAFSSWIDGKVRSFKAHRFAYVMEHGSVADDNFALHRCDNRRCCNPFHLWEGTTDDNMQDMVNKKRCAHGERNPRTTLTLPQVIYIRSSSKAAADLADRFGVHRTTIRRIVRGKTWIHS